MTICTMPECQATAGCKCQPVQAYASSGTSVGDIYAMALPELMRLRAQLDALIARRVLGNPAEGVSFGGIAGFYG